LGSDRHGDGAGRDDFFDECGVAREFPFKPQIGSGLEIEALPPWRSGIGSAAVVITAE
jgi:hypothetical protein